MTGTTPSDGGRIRRLLTFWLRPAFVLRALNRFQKVAGFDRSIALASSTLTALIPLVILAGAILPSADANDVARRIIARYGLTGGGAQAVRDVLSPAGGTSTSISVVGAFLLLIAVLSFSRGVQRLFEQTWELKPLSVRNTLNDLLWIGGLVVYLAFSWGIHSLVDRSRVQVAANLIVLPGTALFLAWTGRVLAAKRIPWRSLVPFAVLGVRSGCGGLDPGGGVHAPPVQHLRLALRRHRGGVGDDLGAVRAHGGHCRLGHGWSRGLRGAGQNPTGGAAPGRRGEPGVARTRPPASPIHPESPGTGRPHRAPAP